MAAFTANPQAPLDGVPNGRQLVPSGVYTATGTAEFNVPWDARMVEVQYIQSAGTAGQSLVLSIEAFNPVQNTWTSLIASAAITSDTTFDVSVAVNPMVPAVTNVSACRALRRRMRAVVTPADTKNVTYVLNVHVS